MDWVISFVERFQKFEEIQNLKIKKFHGSLTINFSDGVPINYNLLIHRRGENNQPKPQEVLNERD